MGIQHRRNAEESKPGEGRDLVPGPEPLDPAAPEDRPILSFPFYRRLGGVMIQCCASSWLGHDASYLVEHLPGCFYEGIL